ncbi:MAG: hypothetical protein IIZ93_01585 [Acidaminococcaceae bacterium]|nr:hypothetical protein [Acidaminococcaceae bacterium]
MSRFYDSKRQELDDDAIIEALKALPNMYEEGQLAEVEDMCYEIYCSILAFETDA